MTWVAFVQGIDGIRTVGEASTVDAALELARQNLVGGDCVGAIKKGRELPYVAPRHPSGAPGGGWRDRARRKRAKQRQDEEE